MNEIFSLHQFQAEGRERERAKKNCSIIIPSINQDHFAWIWVFFSFHFQLFLSPFVRHTHAWHGQEEWKFQSFHYEKWKESRNDKGLILYLIKNQINFRGRCYKTKKNTSRRFSILLTNWSQYSGSQYINSSKQKNGWLKIKWNKRKIKHKLRFWAGFGEESILWEESSIQCVSWDLICLEIHQTHVNVDEFVFLFLFFSSTSSSSSSFSNRINFNCFSTAFYQLNTLKYNSYIVE